MIGSRARVGLALATFLVVAFLWVPLPGWLADLVDPPQPEVTRDATCVLPHPDLPRF